MQLPVNWTEDRHRFKKFVEQSQLLAWITEPNGICIYISPAWEAYTGQTADEAKGYGWLLSVHEDDQKQARRSFFDSNDVGDYYGVGYRLARHDGTYLPTLAIGMPKTDKSGKFAGFHGITVLQTLVPTVTAATGPVEPIRQFRLSCREKEILAAIACGYNTAEISKKLGLSRRTVEAHAQHATLKLGASSRAQACVEAIRLSEIQFDDVDGPLGKRTPN